MQHPEAMMQALALPNALFDNAGFLIIATDAKGIIQLFNTGAQRMLGYAAAEVVNKLSPGDMQDPQQSVALAAHGYAERHDVTYLRKDGSRFAVVESITPLRGGADEITGYVLIGTGLSPGGQMEMNARFLASLDQNLARVISETEVLQKLDAQVAGYLQLSLCVCAESQGAVNPMAMSWPREVLPGAAGIAPLAELMEQEFATAARTGAAIVVRDAAVERPIDAKNFAALNVAAFMCMPLVQDGEDRFVLCLCRCVACDWREDEIDLARQLALRFRAHLQRQRAAAALRQSEARLREALCSAGLGIWNIDPVTGLFTSDARFRSIFGVSVEGLNEQQALANIHPADLPHIQAAVNAAMRPDDPAPYQVEYRVVHPDGSLHWVLAQGRADFAGAGTERKLLSFAGTVADITARKQAEAMLSCQRQSFEMVALGAPLADVLNYLVRETEKQSPQHALVAIHLLDESGQYFAHTFAPSLPAGYSQAVDGMTVNSATGSCCLAVSGRRRVVIADIAGNSECPDFAGFTLPRGLRAACSTPIFSASGNVLGTFVTYYPEVREPEPQEESLGEIVTRTAAVVIERKQAEAHLNSAIAAAQKASLAKSEFLSSMSHELRTPLNAILGFAQLIETGLPPPTSTQQQHLNEILKGGWYLLELINEILDLAVIEAGKVNLTWETIALDRIMLECRAMIEPQARTRGISLTFPGCEIPYHVKVDHTRVKQVLLNLLVNAIKYNRPGGAVTVECTPRPPDSIRISIRDTGAGLAPEQLAQLYQPFNRLGKEAGTEQGTGIGLVVSKRLVELMGGAIGAQSELGSGSVFWIDLSLTSPPQPDIDPGERALRVRPALLLPQDRRVRSLLYVEDNPANLKLVEQLLMRSSNLRLLTAADGDHGIQLARTHQPEVILMDITLPGMSGTEVMQVLHADPATCHIPIVALSANAIPQDIENGLAAGFFRYLTKPINLDELLDTLSVALEFVDKNYENRVIH